MQNLSYDLNTWKCDKVPKLRYIDNPETWAVTFTGRILKPVTSWRAAIETSRKSGTPCVIARIEDGFTLSESTLTFSADCFFDLFRDAVRAFDTGRELNFALYGLDENSKTVEYIEFDILGFPAVDPPDSDPKSLPVRPATTVNGLSGAVRLVDANGNDLVTDGQTITVSGGLQEDSDPLDAYQAYSDTLGPYTWLDKTAASPTLVFFKYQRYLKKVTFMALADNGESTGDVRLIASIDGVDVATFTVAITATAELITLPLEVAAGMLTIRRPTTDELDTLDGAVRISSVSTWRAAA